MTPEDRQRMLRLLLPLVAVLVGTLLTVFAFLLAGFASSACHCSRPITVAFPYAALIWATGKWQPEGAAVMAFQFPGYALVIALAKTRALRKRYALILLAIHAVATVVGFMFYKG